MGLDIFLGAVLVFCMVMGYRNGFTESFLRTIGWVLAIVLGFVWTPTLADYLKAHTGFADSIRAIINERLAAVLPALGTGMTTELAGEAGATTGAAVAMPVTSGGIVQGIPSVLSGYFSEAMSVVGSNTVENLVNIIFSVMALIIIIVTISLVFTILTFLFSKKKRDGIIGASDGLLGLLFGALKGVLIVCIILALILPVVNATNNSFLLDQLNSSTVAIKIYNNNPIFLLTKIMF